MVYTFLYWCIDCLGVPYSTMDVKCKYQFSWNYYSKINYVNFKLVTEKISRKLKVKLIWNEK